MEANWSELTIEKRAGQSDLSAAVESAIPLPEGQPAARVLYGGGRILPGNATVRDGAVETGGTLQLQVLCMSPENKPFTINAAADYTSDIPMAEAKPGMTAAVTQQLTALRCRPENAAIAVTAEMGMQAIAAEEQKQKLITSLQAEAGVEQRKTELPLVRRAKALTHSFQVSGEMSIPQAEQVLLIEGVPVIRGVEPGEGGVTVTGTLHACALTANAEGAMQQSTAQIPIEEWIAGASLPPCPEDSVRTAGELLSINGSISDDEIPVLIVDANIALSVECVMRESIQVLEDAYTTDGRMTALRETLERVLPKSDIQQKCVERQMIEIPSYLPEAYRSVYAAGRAVVTGAEDDNGELTAKGTVYATVVFLSDEGMVYGFEEEVPFSCPLSAAYTDEADISARVLQIAGRGSGRELELTVTLEVRAELQERRVDSVVTELAEGGEEQLPSGILVYLAGEGERLWDVGRRFRLPQSEVRDWNPGIEEPLHEGQQLLLLKGRGKPMQ